jgi:membrane dipeptidase
MHTPEIRWEAHACLPLHPQASFAPLDALKDAGVHYVSINVGMDMNPLAQVMQVIAGYRATIAAHPQRYVLAKSVADIHQAKLEGQIAIGFDLEGALPLQECTDMVALYRDLGVRQIHLAYNRNNTVADGCHDAERGLTPLGQRMVRAIHAAGVLMDCSHTGRRCSLDIMKASDKPVIFSHANPLALVEHGRNITDEQIRACAATGGVVCVSGVSWFLGSKQPTVHDVARHAAYVANLVGPRHVGLGLDLSFDQPDLSPSAFDVGDASYWWPATAGYDFAAGPPTYVAPNAWAHMDAALRAVGMAQDEVNWVMGGNMARVAQTVWS